MGFSHGRQRIFRSNPLKSVYTIPHGIRLKTVHGANAYVTSFVDNAASPYVRKPEIKKLRDTAFYQVSCVRITYFPERERHAYVAS